MGDWHDSYLGAIRSKVGKAKLIVNSVRAVIYDKRGHVLFIRRRGDGRWGMPAGAMELEESVYEAMRREVKEETGLIVQEAVLVAVYSSPETQSYTDRRGNEHHIVEFLFRVERWSGTLAESTDESTDARFFPPDRLPAASDERFARHHERVLRDCMLYRGQVLLD